MATSLFDPVAAFKLEGRVAVVVGSSSGIGARFAEVLGGAGARIVVGARRRDRLDRLADRLRAAGGEAVAADCDVRRETDVERLIATALEAFGGVDVLVNAAGVAPGEDAEIETPRQFRDVVETNLNGTYFAARAAAAAMLECGSGSIVNVSSISGLVSGDGLDTPSYAASKGGVVNLTRELAVRWASRGVRVNAIAPGWFPSEMTATTLASDEGRRFVVERTPMGRPGRAEELDGALLFLASDASSYVTGQTLVVDGGWTAR